MATVLGRKLAAALACLVALLAALGFTATGQTVSLVVSEGAVKPIQHGAGKLKEALQGKGISVEQTTSLQRAGGKVVVVAGLASGAGEAAKLLAELKLLPPTEPESLLVRRVERDGK